MERLHKKKEFQELTVEILQQTLYTRQLKTRQERKTNSEERRRTNNLLQGWKTSCGKLKKLFILCFDLKIISLLRFNTAQTSKNTTVQKLMLYIKKQKRHAWIMRRN